MENKSFKSKRLFLSCEQLLKSKPEKIFPLLCPVREYDWIDTWKCEMVYSNSGFAELDCVFITDLDGNEKEYWVIDKFEKNSTIQFLKFNSYIITRYRISLKSNEDGTTTANWEQLITSVNEKGNNYIECYVNDEYSKKISALEDKLNYYLLNGKCLKPK